MRELGQRAYIGGAMPSVPFVELLHLKVRTMPIFDDLALRPFFDEEAGALAGFWWKFRSLASLTRLVFLVNSSHALAEIGELGFNVKHGFR